MYESKNDVFSVSYNEVLEQPNWVEYNVRNITKKFDRGSMDFYVPKGVHTSDNNDYRNNVWDKGHMDTSPLLLPILRKT